MANPTDSEGHHLPPAVAAYVTPQVLDHQPPGGFTQPNVRVDAAEAALYGVVLGAYDQRILSWAMAWDDPTARTLVSLLWRARMAGRADRDAGWASGTCRR